MLRKAFFRFYARPKIVRAFLSQIHSFGQVRALFERFLYVVGMGRRDEQPAISPKLPPSMPALVGAGSIGSPQEHSH